LRQQLDDWQQLWRQVEAFVDRVETARDEDATGRRKTDALLAAAGAVERGRRAAGVTSTPLGDPVVDRLPTTGWDAKEQKVVPVTAPWAGTSRQARLPGNDDVELAVADLATASPPVLEAFSGALVLDAVRLPRARDTLAVEVGGVVDTLRVPSYPGPGTGIVTVNQADLEVDSLFSSQDRRDATMESLDPPEDAQPFVRSWSWLAARRRAGLPGLDPAPPLSSVGGAGGASGAGAPLSSALLDTAAACVADALAGQAQLLPPGTHAGVARSLADAARSAASTTSPDAAALRAAAEVIDEEGVDSEVEDLVGDLESAADSLTAAPGAFATLAQAAGALAGALSSSPPGVLPSAGKAAALRAPAQALGTALGALPGGGSLAGALAQPPELGSLATELDAVLADRLAYPDGSLRILRTLEVAFARWWPVALRWMTVRARPGRSPDRALRRFLDPFVRSLAAIVQGSDTGLAVDGLVLGEPANISAALLVTDAPASLAPTVGRVVEAGQVAVLAGQRPAAAVVLGVSRQNDRLAVQVAPLRVSLVPPDLAAGSPGFVDAGTALADRGAPLTATELRRGFATDPARDGVVEQAVALHSQLALVIGRAELAARLGAVSVPEPPGPPVGSVPWYGSVPSMTSAFVLHGGPPEWWDRSGDSPLPVLVRPGELLLLRGQVPPDPDGVEAGSAQTVVEVDRAVWLPGSMLDRIDTSRAALLATDAAVLGDVGGAGGAGGAVGAGGAGGADAGGAAGAARPTLLCAPKDDLVLLTLRRTWQVGALEGPLTLRRDFAGFDLASLAIGIPLGDRLVEDVTGSPPPGPTDVDRSLELGAATGLIDDWTRHAR
jgi:hypothetical protein